MELTIRDWMVIVGVLLILAVLLDAWRRMRSERYSRVKLARNQPDTVEDAPESADDDISMMRELPNGGARVVRRADLVNAVQAEAASEPGPAAGDTPADDLLDGISTRSDADSVDWLDGLEEPDTAEPEPASEDQPGKLPRNIDPQVFMLNVTSRDAEGFNGEDILHILLACDLRFGDMNFFHRHEYEAGKGAIQFSVANMMQPGVFDIDNMSDFRTPGLVFFVSLPGPDDMMQAFDYMLETARCVAKNLGGDVLDESRSVITNQSLEHTRQQIRDLERRLLTVASD